MRIWLKQASIDPLSVSMVGVKLADRVLVIGCRDAKLIARLAVKAGLTGRACAVDESDERVAAAARIALREGALVETIKTSFSMLPFDSASFDVVVLRDALGRLEAERRARAVGEAQRVLRPGGRCLAIDTMAATGIARWLSRPASHDPYGGAVDTLRAAGFVAVRVLAERVGLRFVEAVKSSR